MILLSPRLFPLFAFSVLLLSPSPSAFAANDSDAREVRVSFVQGDVRLSRGNGKQPDLNKPWEQAQAGELVEQGFALATGDGRTEIAFEDGSVVYLAENSLLLFTELSAPDDQILTSLTLATGTATFALRPVSEESFFIHTPTDYFQISAPDTFYSRIDAYFDATAITSQREMGEPVLAWGRPNFQMPMGKTALFQGGETLEPPGTSPPELPADADRAIASSLLESATKIAALRATGFFPLVPSTVIPQDLPSFRAAQEIIASARAIRQVSLPTADTPPLTNDWDAWVSARVRQETAVMTAALKASGLSSPVPGLADMYEHGSFFNCGEYGTCWEPTQSEPMIDAAGQSTATEAQLPTPLQSNLGFQIQTVQWRQVWGTVCGFELGRTVSRVAHTEEEFQELLRQKDLAESSQGWGGLYWTNCYYGYWFRHQGHYAKVVTPRHPPRCTTANCKPVHPPRPVPVRAGTQIGFVPRHPNDVDGKPPINLEHGIIVPPSRAGQPVQFVALESAPQIKVLNPGAKESQNALSLHAPATSAPAIRAHLVQETARGGSLPATNRPNSQITYDYRTQKFMMAGASIPGTKSKGVAVGGITSNGRIASFADGHSRNYAGLSVRGGTVTSKVGNGRSSSSSSGSRASSGGRSSGSHSSKSSSSGSHSSHSSHSGGSSSHSSSGGSSHHH